MEQMEKLKKAPGELPEEATPVEMKEKTPAESGKAETLLPETLEFMRNHVDLADFDPSWELREIRAFVKTLPPDA